ncbi:HTH_Tnp_Tc3_2 domain-containing protein [Trichonephila clavipes]|uniref:HTH_Tnp_Tc3_2 domain-containing protein n=1 Tax=Trichonephila clavipes TaxID=2585209 RepID=A0A8X7BCC0_TRICX|nr:HTH_Tnp_Tc3_2 domain-containing protein [Trichonephila clavipes]
MGRSDTAIRICWQEWVDSGRFQRHDGSGRPRATADREDRLIVRSVVTASGSSVSTIRRTTRTQVSTMTLHRRLIERNLRSYQPPRHLPFTPARSRSPDLSPIEHVYDILGRRLHLTGNVHHYLKRQLENICQEIPQETTRVLYDSIAWRMTAFASRLEAPPGKGPAVRLSLAIPLSTIQAAVPFGPILRRTSPLGSSEASQLSSPSTNLTGKFAAQWLFRIAHAAKALYIYEHLCLLRDSSPSPTALQSASLITLPDGRQLF